MNQIVMSFNVGSMNVFIEQMPDEYCSYKKLNGEVHDNVWASGSGDTVEECVASLVASIRKSADRIETTFAELKITRCNLAAGPTNRSKE